MHRRQFLKHSAAATASAAAGPLFLNADDKSGSKAAVVGTGEHTYECDHNWGQLPASIEWQTTHGVAVDAAGLIYITHQGVGNKVMDTVVVFDPSGKYVRSFGKEYHKGGHGIDVRKEGGEEFLYLCHMSANGPVVKATLKGEVVWKKGPPEEAKVYADKKARYNPTNLAFTPDGGFHVADGYGSNLVHRYDKGGNYLGTYGGTGTGPGQFRTPHGIWLDDRKGRTPQIVVADRANARLQYFDLAGKPTGEVVAALFPAHFDTRGGVLLVPDLYARVSLFDVNNKPIVHLGDDEAWRKKVVESREKGKTPVRTQPKEWPAGRFVHPHDACFDKDGNIFVAEWVEGGRISKLKKV